MTLNEFQALADAWGGDVGRWPEHLREAALTLAKTGEAQEILAGAQRIDALIMTARPQSSEDRAGAAMFAVAVKVGAEARDAGRADKRRGLFALPWWAAAAAGIVLGAWLGFEKPLDAWRGPHHQTVLTMIFNEGPGDPGWVLR